jgi:hypothetical protein
MVGLASGKRPATESPIYPHTAGAARSAFGRNRLEADEQSTVSKRQELRPAHHLASAVSVTLRRGLNTCAKLTISH